MAEALIFCGFDLAVILIIAALILLKAARFSFSKPRRAQPGKDKP